MLSSEMRGGGEEAGIEGEKRSEEKRLEGKLSERAQFEFAFPVVSKAN